MREITMRSAMSLFLLILLSNISFGQRTTQKKSYPANLDKIDNIKSSYAGCTSGPCYSWWSIALKDENELLMQHGGHDPAGAKSRHYLIGRWLISGDTLKLDIIPESLDTSFMRTEYRIVNLFNCEILLPNDGSENWEPFLKSVQLKFEQSDDYKEFREYQNGEKVISRLFSDFVRFEYSADKKLLVKKTW